MNLFTKVKVWKNKVSEQKQGFYFERCLYKSLFLYKQLAFSPNSAVIFASLCFAEAPEFPRRNQREKEELERRMKIAFHHGK